MSAPKRDTSSASASPEKGTTDRAGMKGEGEQKKREGPKHLPSEIDRTKKWDEVSSEPGYQRGDQGGYRGGYDEAKFEDVESKHFKPVAGDRPAKPGGNTPTKTPLKQNDPSQQANSGAAGTRKK